METATTGYLYGIMYNDTLVVLTFSVNSYNSEDKNITDYTTLQLNLPADIYFCGILHIGECKEINPDIFKVITNIPYYLHILCLISSIHTYINLVIARK